MNSRLRTVACAVALFALGVAGAQPTEAKSMTDRVSAANKAIQAAERSAQQGNAAANAMRAYQRTRRHDTQRWMDIHRTGGISR